MQNQSSAQISIKCLEFPSSISRITQLLPQQKHRHNRQVETFHPQDIHPRGLFMTGFCCMHMHKSHHFGNWGIHLNNPIIPIAYYMHVQSSNQEIMKSISPSLDGCFLNIHIPRTLQALACILPSKLLLVGVGITSHVSSTKNGKNEVLHLVPRIVFCSLYGDILSLVLFLSQAC